MAPNKKAKYFCENCSAEVAANAKFCPKCGKFFSSVRCPKCGHTGPSSAFKSGCPECHYAMPENQNQGYSTKDGIRHSLSSKSKKEIKNAFSAYAEKNGNQKNAIGDGAPLWLLLILIAVLFLLVGFIIKYFLA